METAKCFFVRGASVVATLELPIRTFAEAGVSHPAIWHRNASFCCPTCGEVWGHRLYVTPPRAGWMFITRGCPTHFGGYFIETFYSDEVRSLVETPDLRSFLANELLAFHRRKVFDYTLT